MAFVGTTNLEEFLSDETGSRRFWPVYVGMADLAAIARDRDQLWAEAVHRYRAGEKWWLDRAGEQLLKRVSLRHQVTDAWQSVIRAWIDDHPRFTSEDVLGDALMMPRERWTHGALTRVGIVCARLGCTKERPEEDADGDRPRFFVRPKGWTVLKSKGEAA